MNRAHHDDVSRAVRPPWPMRGGGIVAALLMVACGDSGSTDRPDGGAPDAAAPAMTEQQVLDACVRLHACGVQRHPRLGDCFSDYYNRYVRFGQRALYESGFRCATAGLGDCKVIRECLGFAGKPKACDASYVARCEGDVAYNCDLIAKWEQQLDCSRGALKCGLKQTGGSGVAAVCGGGSCDPSAVKTECRDRKLFQCVGGALEIIDCPELGLQCRDSALGICEGLGRSCQDFAPECRGTKVVKCESGYRYELDCAQQFGNKICDPANAICVPSGQQCSTDAFFDECDGDTLVACIDGYKQRFDCKQLGFLGCETSGLGAVCKAAPVYE